MTFKLVLKQPPTNDTSSTVLATGEMPIELTAVFDRTALKPNIEIAGMLLKEFDKKYLPFSFPRVKVMKPLSPQEKENYRNELSQFKDADLKFLAKRNDKLQNLLMQDIRLFRTMKNAKETRVITDYPDMVNENLKVLLKNAQAVGKLITRAKKNADSRTKVFK